MLQGVASWFNMKIDQAIIEILEQPVDIRKLVDKLFFNLDALEIAAQKQPKLFLETGKFRAQTSLKRAAYKRRLARIIGKKSLKIRQTRTGLTETAIKNRLALDNKVQHIQKSLDNYEVYEEFAKNLSEAYKERLMVLLVLAKIRASEISSDLRSAMSEEQVDKMRKKANKVRRAFEELEDNDD